MEWFGRSYVQFPFKMYSISHIIIMAIFVLGAYIIFKERDNWKSKNLRKFEIGVALFLLLLEFTYHFWMYINGRWVVETSFPFELCSISLILGVILLLFEKKMVLEILFFTALLGSPQALFFPSLHYAFPHFRFFHFFITHIFEIWIALYYTWVKGFRPTFASVVRLLVFLNLLVPLMMWVNKMTGGNYLYLSHKPKHFSLLDYLGDYPWYILSMEILAIIMTIIVWLIFREKAKPQTEKNIVTTTVRAKKHTSI